MKNKNNTILFFFFLKNKSDETRKEFAKKKKFKVHSPDKCPNQALYTNKRSTFRYLAYGVNLGKR